MIFGADRETVTQMVDSAMHPQHIRFAFNISCNPVKGARDLRFWIVEQAAPALVKKLTIEQAIGKIVGMAESYARGEIERQWVCSAGHITGLIDGGFLSLKGRNVSRASMETFLWIRWTGNNPI